MSISPMHTVLFAIYDGTSILFTYVLLGAIGLTMFGRGKFGAPLVLKSWYASNKPQADGFFICITGRRSGIIGWMFALLGIDPVTTLRVSASRVEFNSSSLAGTAHRITPLVSVSSSFFGYHKPIYASIIVGLLSGMFVAVFMIPLMNLNMGEAGVFFGLISSFVVGLLLAFLYYKFNKTKTIGFAEVGGLACEISFKPSVIEGVTIDEAQAKYAAELMQHLIQTRLDR